MKLPFFPYPHVYRSQARAGSVMEIPAICESCAHKACRTSTENDLGECSYGLNFLRVDQDLLIFGFLTREQARCTKARRKRLKDCGAHVLPRTNIERAREIYRSMQKSLESYVADEQERMVQEYATTEKYKVEFLRRMEKQITRGLSFVHDYRQINSQISQNINVLLETRYAGDTIEEKLSKASHPEASIYHGSKLLEEKLNVAKFLLHPEWLAEPDRCTRFKLHGLVLKYLRMYRYNYEDKGVRLHLQGASHAHTVANPEACSVIPHTFIDNALKYSVRDGRVDIVVQDEADGIYFSVTSFGPRIDEDEYEKIFDPFYRGRWAQETVQEGAGYGLYVSQLIAQQHFNCRINVHQSSDYVTGRGHETVFSLLFPFHATIAS